MSDARRRPLLPEFEAAWRENQRQRAEVEVAFAEFFNWLQHRYGQTVTARVRKILGGRWRDDVSEVVADVWSAAWEWLWTGEARSPIKKTLIRKLKGANLEAARDCHCEVYCECPLTEPATTSRLCHYLAQSIATSFRNKARNRDHDLSNEHQKARKEAEKKGEVYIPPPNETGPESVRIQDYCVQSARRFLGLVKDDDQDVMETDPDYDDSDAAFQPESYLVDLQDGENQEFRGKGWSTALSLKPPADLQTNVTDLDRTPAVLQKPGRKICGCRTNAVICTCPPDPYFVRAFEILDSWKLSGSAQCETPIRVATQAEWDQWTKHSAPEISIEKAGLKGFDSDWFYDCCSEARMVDEDDDEEMEEAMGMDESTWLHHRIIGHSKLIRHLDNGLQTWIVPRGKREPVLVATVDLSDKKWKKPRKPRAKLPAAA